MTALLAGAAAALGVLAVFEALTVLEGRRALAVIERLLRPARRAVRDGAAPTAAERRRLGATAGIALGAGGWILAGPIAGVLCAALGPAAAVAALALRRRRWRRALGAGAPPAARALADALGTGRSLTAAIALAAADRGLARPAARVLGEASDAIALGTPVGQALDALRLRTGPGPWEAIVAAVLLQRNAGGDLPRLLRELADGLDAAARVEAEARAASAQARLTARIVLALPALAALLAEASSPGALGAVLGAPLPRLLIGAALVLQVIALVAVRRIARLGPP